MSGHSTTPIRRPGRCLCGATRFCGQCGSPMSFAGVAWPGEIHFFVASFENPASLVPARHVHVRERAAWLHLGDALPRFATTPRDGPPLAADATSGSETDR